MGEVIVIGSPLWHETRRRCITGTDCPALLGVTPDEGRYANSTPLKIARRIKIARGLMPGVLEDDEAESDLLYAGTASEDLNAKLYERIASRESGQRRVVLRDHADFRTHPQFDWLASTTDGLVIHADFDDPKTEMSWGLRSGSGVFECKMPIWARNKWRDGAPLAYKLQVTVGMAIRGLEWGSISGLRLPTVDWSDIEFNEATWRKILAFLQDWHARFVLQDQMPDAEAGDIGLLRELHRPTPRKVIFLPPALSDTAHELAELQAQASALESEIKAKKATIQQALQEAGAEIATTADGEVSYRFRRYMQKVKAKPAVEAGEKEATEFERFYAKEK